MLRSHVFPVHKKPRMQLTQKQNSSKRKEKRKENAPNTIQKIIIAKLPKIN
jgi:hypothetical protein